MNVSNEAIPFIIGLDVVREYGLVIDNHDNRVYSCILNRHFPCAVLPTGHLALEMMPRDSEKGRLPVTSQALSTRHWDLHSRAKEKETRSLESLSSHPLNECAATSGQSGYDHDHISKNEDDLFKLLNLPESTQTWTHFDKRARTNRTTLSSGLFVEGRCGANYD